MTAIITLDKGKGCQNDKKNPKISQNTDTPSIYLLGRERTKKYPIAFLTYCPAPLQHRAPGGGAGAPCSACTKPVQLPRILEISLSYWFGAGDQNTPRAECSHQTLTSPY